MNIGNLAENHKSLANHASDFEQMFYNIWKQQTLRTEIGKGPRGSGFHPNPNGAIIVFCS
jgi:hypothetical protein